VVVCGDLFENPKINGVDHKFNRYLNAKTPKNPKINNN
jgi:hypothetical protein